MVHPYEASCFTAAPPAVSLSEAVTGSARGTEGFGLVGAAFALALCFGGALEVARESAKGYTFEIGTKSIGNLFINKTVYGYKYRL